MSLFCFINTPESFYLEVTADRYIMGSNKARTIDKLIWALTLSICDYVMTAGPSGPDFVMTHFFPPLTGPWRSASAGLTIGRVLDTIRFYSSQETTCPWRNKAVSLFEYTAITFQETQKPSPDIMFALSSAAWPIPNQCSLLDWRVWRAEFNREVNNMQQKEPSSVWEGR